MRRGDGLPRLAAVSLRCGGGLTPAPQARSLAQARALATEPKLPVMIEVWIASCSPCAAFDRASNSDRALQPTLEHLVQLGTGCDATADRHWLLKIVAGFPTLIVWDQQAGEIDR